MDNLALTNFNWYQQKRNNVSTSQSKLPFPNRYIFILRVSEQSLKVLKSNYSLRENKDKINSNCRNKFLKTKKKYCV